VNLSQRLTSILHVLTSKPNLVGGLCIEIPIRMTLLTNAINHLLERQMFNPQSFIINVSYSKVNVNVYLLHAQQIFITVRAILTRNSVMNHHMQRELTMAEKRMYGDLKLLIQNASKSGKPLVASCSTTTITPARSTTSTTSS
jgi:hypothetical protein